MDSIPLEAPELLVFGVSVIGILVAAMWGFAKSMAEADVVDAFYDSLRSAGYELSDDTAGAWVRSQGLPLPLGVHHHDPDHPSKHGQPNRYAHTQLARREHPDLRVVVYLCPKALAEGYDRVMVAVDPLDRPVVASPEPQLAQEVVRETGWRGDAHGAWLVLRRVEREEPPAEDAAEVVEEGIRAARRLLGGSVR